MSTECISGSNISHLQKYFPFAIISGELSHQDLAADHQVRTAYFYCVLTQIFVTGRCTLCEYKTHTHTEKPTDHCFYPDRMPLTLISVPGTCPQHVVRAQARACPCQCLHVVLLSGLVYVQLSNCRSCKKFMFNLFKCVHKACCCRFRQSSQLVRRQLFLPSRFCLSHILPPPSIPSQFAHSPFLPHFCHYPPKKQLSPGT